MSIEKLDTITCERRPKIFIPRGWPGSGKDFLFEQMRQDNPMLARVSRDDERATLFCASGPLAPDREEIITKAERAKAAALLDAGYDVYVSAMNLRAQWARGWANFALLHGADFEVIDLETSVEECILRDKARGEAGGRSVGEDVIHALARRFPHKSWPKIEASPDLFFRPTPYVPDESLPQAWITDLDGTLAEKAPGRNIYDYTRVHEDIPIAHTVEVIRKLSVDSRIIVLSGRDSDCQHETADWLRANDIPFDELHMRATGDKRPDFKVKTEIFDAHIRHRFHVLGVFDDRLSVARAWHRMGLPLMRLGIPDHDDF